MNKADLIKKLKNDGIFEYDDDMVGAVRKNKSQFFEPDIEYDKYNIFVGTEKTVEEDVELAAEQYIQMLQSKVKIEANFSLWLSDVFYEMPDEVAWITQKDGLFRPIKSINKIGWLYLKMFNFGSKEIYKYFENIEFTNRKDYRVMLDDFRFDIEFKELKDEKLKGVIKIY
ncbi:MAG: hypothetical protein ACQEQF_00020 [Bacillota bacterium]